MPTTVEIEGGRPLRATLSVPGDKSVSHRALILAALSDGPSTITGLSDGADVRHTTAAVAALGASVSVTGPRSVTVAGGSLHEPAAVIDVGNSGTGIRLLAGLAAALDGLTVLQGDTSIAGRPMDRIAEPLRLMGARVDGRSGGRYPPLTIRGGSLRGISYELPVPSAQVKSAILIAALAADGETVVREPVRSRVHTEEMLVARGADITTEGTTVRLRRSALAPRDETIPGDPSQAAFWLVGAAAIPGSEVTVEGLYIGPARTGFLDVLVRMGADLAVERSGDDPTRCTVRVRGRALQATDIGAAEVPGLVDEIPVLAVAAALARGTTTISGAAELRVKESDRIVTTGEMLRAFGVTVAERLDGLIVQGGSPLRGAAIASHGDHRIAMAAAIAALAADGRTLIDGFEAVATSYPTFLADLERCAPGALRAGTGPTPAAG